MSHIRAMFVTGTLLSLLTLQRGHSEDYTPDIAPASDDGQQAIAGFKVPANAKVELVAAEPMLANPVAFTIDEQGRFYICETFRQQKGVEDNRSHMDWLHDDLAAQTVDDRLKYLQKHLGDKIGDYAKEHDRIRLLTDTNGDGKADKSVVFADGFNDILDGTGAGILAHRGDVYYTCIPKLYKLRDHNGDGKTDTREVLANGFGVRFAFRGHDMHGLVMGPDGRIYFSIGDRGFHVITKEGVTLHHPDTGAVLRCELDGSDLEVFAYGLRNPQELAFDDYGNLFTADNNSDSGDQARWVHIVEGMDAGWRMYYQYLPDRGPWNREMMWYPRDNPPLEKEGPGGVPKGTLAKDVQPAYIVPPIANLGDGPSGLTAYPGVGLPERYNGHFFLCDFRGGAGNSGIRSFANKPKGASFELVDSQEFLWSTLATDCDFGYDGHLYFTDWVNGWNGEGKGRLYRLNHEANKDGATVAKLFKDGFGSTSVDELAKLLGHADRRVRMAAQFELKSGNADDVLIKVAGDKSNSRFQRLHAMWGLRHSSSIDAIVGAEKWKHFEAFESLVKSLVADEDPLIRANSIVLLDRLAFARREFRILAHMKLINDPSPVVRRTLYLRNARVLGLAYTLSPEVTVEAIEGDLLQEETDSILRHAAIQVLKELIAANGNSPHVQKLFEHQSLSIKIACVVASRRWAEDSRSRNSLNRFPGTAEHFSLLLYNSLESDDELVLLEVARTINDVLTENDDDPIILLLRKMLAKLAERPGLNDPLLRRVLNANFRLGRKEHAERVLSLAANGRTPEHLRIEALDELLLWTEPPPTDRVTGMWRPLEKREAPWMADVLRPRLGGLFAGSEKLRERGVKLAAKYGIKDIAPELKTLFADEKQPGNVRAEALKALAVLKADGLQDIVNQAIQTNNVPAVRAEALGILADLDPAAAVKELSATAIFESDVSLGQNALAILGTIEDPQAEEILLMWMQSLQAGDVTAAYQLDVLDAAKQRNTPKLQAALAAFEKNRSGDDALSKFRECLEGGNAERGKEIFFGRSEVSCRRCHQVEGSGGMVGPDLTGIGKKQKRDYLLEAIVLPNAKIAKGFETVLVATDEGQTISGILKSQDDDVMRLMDAKGAVTIVRKDSIVAMREGQSAMPADLFKFLTKSELRDVVEYLTSLKTDPKPDTEHKE